MEKSEMLRSVWFGGYGKEGVQKYIETLESEIAEIKVSHQEEKKQLTQKLQELEEYKQEQDKQISEIQKELAQVQAELKNQIQISANTETKLIEKDAMLMEKEALVKQEADRAAELERRLQQQQEQNEKAMLDFQTITKVLEDVTQDAELMREEAREEGRKIVAEAIVEAETRKNVIAKRVESELEEKAIQLVAAKHKVSQYVKEVNDAQQGLYDIYSRLQRMVDEMPIKLEEFWDGEEYRALEESLRGQKERKES